MSYTTNKTSCNSTTKYLRQYKTHMSSKLAGSDFHESDRFSLLVLAIVVLRIRVGASDTDGRLSRGWAP